MRISRAGKSNCKDCPLDGGCTKVWGLSGIASPKIIVLGEAPGATEDKEGKPFVGSAGKWLRPALAKAGIRPEQTYMTNVISCRPPANNIKSIEAEEALIACQPGLWYELKTLHKHTNVILALGVTAMNAVGIGGSLTKNRGSVYEKVIAGEKFIIVPTYHPSFIMQGGQREEPTWINDIDKALDIAVNGWNPPKENFEMFPTIEWLEKKVAKITSAKKPPMIGVDIETMGSLSPWKSQIVVVGIATSASDAFSIPFYSKGRVPYWSKATLPRAKACLQKLLDHCIPVFQNAPFDISHMMHQGYELKHTPEDILLLHHTCSPELPHNLGYIVSGYGKTPYWKDIALDSSSMMNLEDEELRRYNLRDAVVLLQVYPALVKDAKETGVYHIYETIMKQLIMPSIRMSENGMLISQSRLAKFRKDLGEKQVALNAKLRELTKVPDRFNFSSNAQIAYLFYGVKPASFDKRLEEFRAYDKPGSKKKKNTKKYAELKQYIEVYTKAKVLPRAPIKMRETESKNPQLDSLAINAIIVACNNAVATQEKQRKKPNQKTIADMRHLRDVCVAYLELQEVSKLYSTYTSFPVEADGRIHPRYMLHGTRTGRPSAREPNLLNIPKEARKLMVPEKGWMFMQADYSNLELRVLSYEADDDVLQDQFARNLNIHTENCKVMYGIDEIHPKWDAARKSCKTYVFGRNYGGSIRGIFEKVVVQVPELELTYADFYEMDQRYFKAHPKYAKWRKRIEKQVLETRCVTTAFGRKRFFLGTDSEIVREGLNTPIQGTAADITNEAIIKIDKRLREENVKARIATSVYDSIVLEVWAGSKSNVEKAYNILVGEMQRPRHLWNKDIVFPVDVEVSAKSWGEMVPWSEWNEQQHKKATKKATSTKRPARSVRRKQ